MLQRYRILVQFTSEFKIFQNHSIILKNRKYMIDLFH